jgi:hypothetical protein
MVYLYVRSLPYPYDKPAIEFNINFKGVSRALGDYNGFSTSRIYINVLSTYLQKVQPAFEFIKPVTPNMFIVLHINFDERFNQIIYEFQAAKPTITSTIVYRIMNPDIYNLRIENNFLRMIYPFSSLDDFKRSEYLVFKLILKVLFKIN